MNGSFILNFLSDIKKNNNRPWFAENKEYYQKAMDDFDIITNLLIAKISEFDKSISGIQSKDCIYRIYRDVRFSPDKSPYKRHFGTFISVGGRKSLRAGYYFHMEPDGNSVISGGLYCPEANVLRTVRQAIVNDIEDYKAIVENSDFKHTFSFDDANKLKTVPKGFAKDFPDNDYLKYKHYTLFHSEPDSFFSDEDFLDKTIDIFKKMEPFNSFLNNVVDDILY